jgi:hypothetical protein
MEELSNLGLLPGRTAIHFEVFFRGTPPRLSQILHHTSRIHERYELHLFFEDSAESLPRNRAW